MERRALEVQRLDILLHRALPFALICAFLAASVTVAFISPIAGAIALVGTMAGVLTAYLTGRPTKLSKPSHQPPPQ
jgi:flagellar motor component MotA